MFTGVAGELPDKEQANLDCLRAFAVAAVLLNHISLLLAQRHHHLTTRLLSSIGMVGVIAFFVHTSLVLMLSLERMPAGSRTLHFYLRRIFRIYPLSIACVVCVLVFKIPASPMADMKFIEVSDQVIAANLLLMQNIIGKYSVSGPLWSLPFEVQMYAVLPLAFAVARSRNALARLLGIIVAFALLGWMVQFNTGHAGLLAFIPCFLAGVVAYVFSKRLRRRVPALLWPFAVVIWIILTTWSLTAPVPMRMPASWAASLLLGMGIFCFRDSTHRGWNQVTAFVAKYSYGVYLSHTPLLWFVFGVLRIGNDAAGVLLWLGLTLLASVLLYHALEGPLKLLGHRLTPNLPKPSIPALQDSLIPN